MNKKTNFVDDRPQNEESKKIDEIMNELNGCRDDIRNSDNQLVQAITILATIFAFIFGTSIWTGNKDSLLSIEVLILSDCVFCIVFSYIITLGISSVLRHHYIRNLEDKLYKLIPATKKEEEFIHWISFSSPITTRNPLHLKSFYSWIHYIGYTTATLVSVFFSLYVTYLEYRIIKAEYEYAVWGIIIPCIFMIFTSILYFVICYKAKDMYKFSLNKSIEDRKKRIDEYEVIEEYSDGRQKSLFLKEILYFIYPKKKDLQKIIVIILGVISGIILKNDFSTFEFRKEDFTTLFLVLLVIDFLIYQARYQLNDIRGISEDLDAGKTDRLPVGNLGVQHAVNISLLILFGRIVIAGIVIFHVDKSIRTPLFWCSIMVVFCTFIYEWARSKKNNLFILCFVSLGYPIRFLAGIWTIWPEAWQSQISTMEGDISASIVLCVLLIFFVFLGEFFVIIPWIHETIVQAKKSKNGEKNFSKSYYKFLWNNIIDKDLKGDSFSFEKKGNIKELWNLSYIGGMISLTVIIVISKFSIWLILVEILVLVGSVKLCLVSSKKKSGKFILGMCVGIIFKMFLFSYVFNFNLLFMYICVLQVFYTGFYFFLRYNFLLEWDFTKEVYKFFCVFWKQIYLFVVGKETNNIIVDIKKKKEEFKKALSKKVENF